MPYIGTPPAPVLVNFRGVQTQAFSGTGSASLFTLNRAVQAVTDIEVIVNNVQQSPFDGSYSIVNNGLGLQFSENPSAGTNNIYVIYRDQPLGSLYDTGAVRKSGDTMTGTLTVGGNVLASPNSGGGRVFGVSGGTNTTVVIQSGAAVGSGPNLELDANHIAYLDSNTIRFRSTDASLSYGGFDTAGRFTLPNQPSFIARGVDANITTTNGYEMPFPNVIFNQGGHFNGSTGRFTAPVAGTYLFTCTGFVNNSIGRMSFKVNNGANNNMNVGFSGGIDGFSQSTMIRLAQNDYVSFGDWQSISGTILYAGHTIFTGALLG